jgi:hypothetical protein
MNTPENERDPIVEEVRRARRKTAEKFDFDIHRIFEDPRSRERDWPAGCVSFDKDGRNDECPKAVSPRFAGQSDPR